MHVLDGAYQRVDRAGEHLKEVRRRCKAHRKAVAQTVVIERKPETFLVNGREVKGVRGSVSAMFGPVPERVAIVVGETIYNLRAALDYLVAELAAHDAKKPIPGTYFPIESTEKGFIKHRPTYLNGVNDPHVAMIERLQPYNGCDWTAVLRDISNPDKHSRLTTLPAPVVISPGPGSTQRIINGKKVKMEKDVSIKVTLSDGTPVVETLEKLHREVAATLEAFDPEFK